jgi:hypothetical protein
MSPVRSRLVLRAGSACGLECRDVTTGGSAVCRHGHQQVGPSPCLVPRSMQQMQGWYSPLPPVQLAPAASLRPEPSAALFSGQAVAWFSSLRCGTEWTQSARGAVVGTAWQMMMMMMTV